MMTNQQRIAEARAEGDPQKLAAVIPYSTALGITMALEDDILVAQMAFEQRLIGDVGVGQLHGGSIATLLESTAIFTLLWQIDDMTIPKTINLTVEYLRPGRPKTTYATAEITRHGNRVANLRCLAWQDDRDKPIAAAYCHALLVNGT